jgi:hypothetical protein
VNFRRLRTGLGLVAFLVVATVGAGVAQVNPNAPPPPPLPNATMSSTSVPATPQATFAPAAAQATAVPGVIPTPAPALSPSPSPRPRRGHRAAPEGTPSPDATDTPEPPQFDTLDGIWEIEVQRVGKRLALYEHFSIQQKGSVLSGYWEHAPHKTRTPLTGSFDGRVVQISAKTDDGATATFSGYVETMSDMVGIRHLSATDPGTAFTAQHRKKEGSKI